MQRTPLTLRVRLFVLLAAMTALVPFKQVGAQETAARTALADVTLGFGDEAQVGHWTPIRVSLEGKTDDIRIEVTADDGDGVPTVYRESASSSGEIRYVYVKLGRRRGAVNVRAVNSAGEVEHERRLLLDRGVKVHNSTRESILYLTPPDAGLIDLDVVFRKLSRPAEERPIVYYAADAEMLPDEWFGYASVDQIFITTSASGMLDRMSDKQRDALEMWVRLGGRLVICLGKRAVEVGKLDSIRDLLPGEPTEVVTQQRAVGMEEYVVQTSQPLTAYELALFKETKARAVASEQSLTGRPRPVVMRHSHGMGSVTTVATDLELAPFLEWKSLHEVIFRLMRLKVAESNESRQSGAIGRVSHIGYEDLSGQLRSSLDRFAGPTGGSVMIAFSPVAAFLAIYILLIAPGDYFFLRRLIGRMELTWLTFPVIVVLACGAILWASSKLKRDQFALNQFDVVDFDHETSTLRGHTWASAYSPSTASHDIDLTPRLELSLQEGGGGAQQEGRLLSWMGLPGRGLGGLDTATAGAFDAPYAIEFDDERTAVLRGLPIAIASTKQLSGVWWRTRVNGGEVNLTRKRGFIQGEFANPFPVELQDGLLFYNDWVYAIRRRILPDQTISVAEMEAPRDMVWRLTRRRVIDSKSTSSYENTPWNPTDESSGRLMELLTLYERAGGQAYTQLTHRYLDQLDLSEHLANGRAVFIGRVEAPVTELSQDGRPLDANAQRWTYCRAIFPVNEPPED